MARGELQQHERTQSDATAEQVAAAKTSTETISVVRDKQQGSSHPEEFSVRDHVLAKYEDGAWYSAAIRQDNGDGTFTLDWDDGDKRDRVKPRELIKPWKARRPSLGATKAAFVEAVKALEASDATTEVSLGHPRLSSLPQTSQNDGFIWNPNESRWIPDVSRWNPNIQCGSWLACERVEWMRDQDPTMSLKAARQQVMLEFAEEFFGAPLKPLPFWNPEVVVSGQKAGRRAIRLAKDQDMSFHFARLHVMSEFKAEFFGEPAPRWKPHADCDGFTAQDRADWLTLNEAMPAHVAELQVMMEYPTHFAPEATTTKDSREIIAGFLSANFGFEGKSKHMGLLMSPGAMVPPDSPQDQSTHI